MQPNLRLQLRFVDRIGIVSDIAAILTENELNNLVMERPYPIKPHSDPGRFASAPAALLFGT